MALEINQGNTTWDEGPILDRADYVMSRNPQS